MARKSRINLVETQELQSLSLYRAGIYRRLSEEDGDDLEANSLVNQEKIARHHLMDYPEIEIVDIYTDNGYTGMNFKRPGFIRMKEDFLSGRINCIIVKDVSRLGRNFVITSEYVEKILPELGVRLICINDDYDSADENADAAALMLPFKMIMNESYSRDTSLKIRSTISAMMNNGEFLPPAGSIPFGYIRNPEKNTFDVDTEVAHIIVLIFELRASGMKFNAIAKELIDRELPSPGKIRFMRGITKDKRFENAQWIRGTIRKITNDPVYLGHRIHGKVKSDKLGQAKTRRSKDEWQIIENMHPAIITQELFDAVQKVNAEELDRLSKYKQGPKLETDYRTIFQDKLYCSDCNSRLQAQKGSGRPNSGLQAWIAYECNGYLYSHRSKCHSHYIRQEVLMNAVTNLLNKHVEIAVDIEKLISDIKTMPAVARHQTSITDLMKSCTVKRQNLESKIEQLLIDLTDGTIDRDEYDYMKIRYTHQLELQNEEYDRLSKQANELGEVISSTQQWINAIKEYHKLPVINRELFVLLVDKIYVSDGNKIKIQLMYDDPYKSIMDYLKKVEVLGNVG